METQNVTLSIPKDILRRAKMIAIERDTSLSGLLTQTLEEIVVQADEYSQARDRHLDLLAQGLDLGTQGIATWSREELHER